MSVRLQPPSHRVQSAGHVHDPWSAHSWPNVIYGSCVKQLLQWYSGWVVCVPLHSPFVNFICGILHDMPAFLGSRFRPVLYTKVPISCWQELLVLVVTGGVSLTPVSVLILSSILARITICSCSSLGIPGLFQRRVNRGHSIACQAVVLVWQALEHHRTIRHPWHRLFHWTGMSGDDWSAFRRKQQAHVNG